MKERIYNITEVQKNSLYRLKENRLAETIDVLKKSKSKLLVGAGIILGNLVAGYAGYNMHQQIDQLQKRADMTDLFEDANTYDICRLLLDDLYPNEAKTTTGDEIANQICTIKVNTRKHMRPDK